MQKLNSPAVGRISTRLRSLRVIAIIFVILLAVAIGILQTSAAKNQAQQPTGPRTYQPTSIPIKKFEPLNFAAAAAAEQLSAATEGEQNEIEEVDEPGPKPQFASNVPINKATVDAARSAQAPLSFGTGISPGPSKTFKAEFISGTTIPPDTMGAVGTTHIVTVTNDRMRIQTRDGVEVSRLTVTSFWAGVTIKGAAASAFDTKVLFDRFNNRFFIESSGNGQNVNSGAMFAVSATADPTGAWYRWSVAADATSTAAGGHWIDFPSVGHNKNWFVIDENVFNFGTAGTAYWGQQVYVLDKQAAYNNTLATINLFEDPFTNCVAPGDSTLGCGFTMAPAVTEDNTTDTVYMAEDWDSTAAQLRLSKITGTPAAPVITVGTQFPQSANSWRFNAVRLGTANNCGGTCSGGYSPQRQQSANLISGTRIQTNDSRIQNSVLRNGKLWTVHHVMLSASAQPAGTAIGGTGNPIDNHSAIQWWQIDPTNETAASTPPLQRGRIEDPTANNCHNGNGGTTAVAPCNGTTAVQFGTFLAFPSISVNQNEDVLIGFTQMSPFTYPAGAYAIRRAADTANTMRDIVVFRPGQSNYNIGSGSGTARQNRWGDYSAAQTDPLNDTDFWTVQEYAGTNRNDFLAPSYAGPWETWWGQVKPSDVQPSNSGGLIISEFRLRGPQGVRDEFVELYNPALVPLIIQTGDNSDGWALAYSSNGTTVSQVFAVIPNGTVIPPHGHFLVADNPDNTAGGTSALTYSLNAASCIEVRGADSDTGWSLDLADNGGIALFSTATTANFLAGTRVDSAGFSTIAAGLFKEGNGIPAVTAATPTGQIAFYRDLSSGTPKDTGANESDFIFANPVVGETLGSTPRLGAAGPENLSGPISLNGSTTLPAALVDTGVGFGSGPNYVRDNTPVANGAFGTLTLRRKFTNNTGANLTRLRFRIVDITGNPAGVSAADLRVLSASSTSVSLSGGGTANIADSTLETPPTQAAGGGINGSITIPAVTFASPFGAESSMNLQFMLGVQTTGNFNFCLVPEGVGSTAVSAPLCFSGNTENTPPSITPASISRNGGDSSSSTIASVNDSEDGAGSLTVTATSVPSGITVTGITNTGGTVTATVGADCSLATGPYNVTLRVADSNGATTDGTLVVNVTATPAPATPTISADTNGTGTQDQACPEQPLTLHANGAAGATSYQWYKDVNVLNGETNATYQATSAGTYYVTATGVCGTTPQSAGYVVQNPTPHSPFVSFRGQSSSTTTLAICQGSSQIIDSDSPTGIHWWKDGVDLGPGSQSLTVTQAGVYTAQLNALGCHSQFGRNVTVTVNPLPPTPTITPGGPTTFCQGGSVTLTSSSASGNQWYLNGNPIGGATNNTYGATASGNYTVVVTDANSCASSPSAATSVTVNPTPATPTITPGGPTTFCQGGSVTLSSSSATGNQWYKNGNPIGGATSQTFIATATGNYTVVMTDANSCASAPSAATSVTVNPNPDATITTATQECAGSTGNTASVANAGVGATYNWSITNGTITGGAGTSSITYTAGGVPILTLQVTVTTAAGCSDTKSTNVAVNPNPAKPTITPAGPTTFPNGGSVTLNSSSATGNQWYLNGNPIGGATNSSLVANAAGNYTVVVTNGNGCSSPTSDPIPITICVSAPVVTNGNDNGAGSLRQAILDACDGATITFQAGLSNVTLTSAGLTLDKNLTITGPGANLLTVQRSTAGGTPDFRIFTINPGKVVTISGLTVSNGKLTGGLGGGILNQNATLNLVNTAVTGNSVAVNSGLGGGICNQATASSTATMTITNSTISGNSAPGNGVGGGIGNFALSGNTATMTITNSTVSGNSADAGGGISSVGSGASVTITNVTISGNSATGIGGGGGIAHGTGTPTTILRNTIVAGNTNGEINATVDPSSSFNLIGNNSPGGLTNGVNNNQVGVANALLAPLANYGGPTQTHALLPGSPAINAGSNPLATNVGLLLDQRSAGFNRIVNGTVDIGAFESRGFTIAPTSGSGQSTVFSTAFGSPLLATVSSAFAEPVVGGQVTFTAPGSGASATFTGGVTTLGVTINASGQASVSATANATVGGPYNVGASALGTASTNFSLTNIQSNQTITFNALGNKTFGDADFPVSATASSGLPVSFTASGSCSVSTNTVHLTAVGLCTITAKQAGNSNYNAAPDVPRSFIIGIANQTITFNALVNKTFGDPDFPVSATASSNLTVSFAASGKCTINTNTVHLTGAGSCTITAHQGGGTNYNPAEDVPRSFNIAQAATTTAVSSSANPSNLTQNVTFTATVTGPAGTGTPTGTVTFKDGAATITCANAGGQTLNASGVATCQTSTLTAGTHTISAVYSGDTNFLTSTGTLSPNQFVNNLPLVSFSVANYNVNEADGVVHVLVNRAGDTTVPFNVDYATSDTGASTNCAVLNTGLASSRCDFDTVLGTLKFAANQTQATIDITINQDGRTEGPENFTIGLSNATGVALLVSPATAMVTINDSAPPAPNAIDDTTAFVRAQYHDFLNREPDAAGLAFWVQNIDKCSDPAQRAPGQTQAQCIQTQRVITSAAFFLSIEFMQTGTFVRSFYVATLDRPATNNMPDFREWLRDTQAVQRGVIVNQGNWQAMLDANRLAFMQDFVMRPEFVGLYPTIDTPAQYINKLYNHALGRTPTTTELVDALSVFGGAATASDPTARGQALLKVTQAADFIAREIPRAFVQIEYFGYLRRNPNDAPDNNFNGYNFWLNKLNQFGGDFLKAEMVKAFIESPEYRQRFAP